MLPELALSLSLSIWLRKALARYSKGSSTSTASSAVQGRNVRKLKLRSPSEPVDLIRVQRQGSKAFRCGVAEMQGKRPDHEDAHAAHIEGDRASAWVLDGHRGDSCARFGAQKLLDEFRPVCESAGGLPTDDRIRQGFENIDQQYRDQVLAKQVEHSGSTVIGALVDRQASGLYDVKVLNCGDSRAIVFPGPDVNLSDDKYNAKSWSLLMETKDHKPANASEKARIEAAGGFVTEHDISRVDGLLGVSRALGDFEFKDAARPPSERKVSCVPDIYAASGFKLGTLLVIACDGIWDVMSSEAVAAFVTDRLRQTTDLAAIAADLIRHCLEEGSSDNMTAMVIHLVDGSDWQHSPDEVLDYQAIMAGTRQKDRGFLRSVGFPDTPSPCASCGRWLLRNGTQGECCDCGR